MMEVIGWMMGIFAAIVVMTWIVKAKSALKKAFHKFVVNEGNVALLYKDGKFVRRLEPGKHRFFGFDYTTAPVDMRKSIQTVPGQDVLTSDTLNVKVSLTDDAQGRGSGKSYS